MTINLKAIPAPPKGKRRVKRDLLLTFIINLNKKR